MARQLERAELTHCRDVRHCQLARGSSERLWLLELTEGMQAARGAHELHDRPLYERAHPTADYFFNRAELDAPPVELDLPIIMQSSCNQYAISMQSACNHSP